MAKYFSYVSYGEMDVMSPGSHVYLSLGRQNKNKKLPAIVLPAAKPEHMMLVYIDQSDAITTELSKSLYDSEWSLYTADMHVPTPAGDIVVCDKDDDEYPGINIMLHTPHSNNDYPEITLSMVEYTSGGELVNSADFGHKNIRDVANRTDEFKKNIKRMRPGLVTRAFPDDAHEDRQIIALHHGHVYRDTCKLPATAFDAAKQARGKPMSGNTLTTPVIEESVTFCDGIIGRIHVFSDGSAYADLISEQSAATLEVTQLSENWNAWTVWQSHNGVEYGMDFEVIE